MSWSLTIGRFGATTVRVHLTFFLLLAWIGVSAWEKGGLPAARDSVLFIALIFACVVLHEFGHIVMARRFGIETWPGQRCRARLLSSHATSLDPPGTGGRSHCRQPRNPRQPTGPAGRPFRSG